MVIIIKDEKMMMTMILKDEKMMIIIILKDVMPRRYRWQVGKL